MNQTITGRFHTRERADTAASLIANYIPAKEICVAGLAFVGHHKIEEPLVVSDQQDEEDEAAPISLGAAVVAGVAAATVGALASPVVAFAAAGAAIYVGSLAGALNGLEDHSGETAIASSDSGQVGVTVSVRVDNADQQSRVLDSMRTNGAAGIVQVDSDPVVVPPTASSGYN